MFYQPSNICRFFDPKWRNMTPLKRHFLKNFSTNFSVSSVADVKLMLGKVLKVSRRYLLPFLSYPEKPTGGGIRPPPPSGARVNVTELPDFRWLGVEIFTLCPELFYLSIYLFIWCSGRQAQMSPLMVRLTFTIKLTANTPSMVGSTTRIITPFYSYLT